MTDNGKFLTFDEWVKANPEVVDELTHDCDECDGSGQIECPECGHIAACDDCGGSGKISEVREEYKRQLKIDKARLEKWR